MQYKKVQWGAILIVSGVIILLNNIGIISIGWRSIFALWPLIFVFWGISILPAKEYVKIILGILSIGVGLFLLFNYPGVSEKHLEYIYENETEVISETPYDLTEPMDSGITTASLSLDAAAGNYFLNTDSLNLFKFNSQKSRESFSVTCKKTNSNAAFQINTNTGSRILSASNNHSSILLNSYPIWDVDIDAGAALIDADFSSVKVKSFSLDGGACTATLRFGLTNGLTSIKIDAGAASITIYVPKKASCEINNDAVLTDKQFSGFTRIKSGLWRSTDYNGSSLNRINIEIDAAVTSVSIIRY